MKIGIIAEDDSDVSVVHALTLALVRPYKLGYKRFVGDGCGKLRRKCEAWARNLVQQGCRFVMVVHDLDQNHEQALRAQLTAAINPAGAQAYVVLIPKREIEAWLLYDGNAIASVFRENASPPLPGNPESLTDRRSIWKSWYGADITKII
jgi:hypothetical protein